MVVGLSHWEAELKTLCSPQPSSPAWLPTLGETAQAVRGEGILELIVAVACECREVPTFLGPFRFSTPHPGGSPDPWHPLHRSITEHDSEAS